MGRRGRDEFPPDHQYPDNREGRSDDGAKAESKTGPKTEAIPGSTAAFGEQFMPMTPPRSRTAPWEPEEAEKLGTSGLEAVPIQNNPDSRPVQDVEAKEEEAIALKDRTSASAHNFGMSVSPRKAKISISALPTVKDHTTDQLGPEGDEYLPREIDENGEKKVNAYGQLLGERQYTSRIFPVHNRGNKHFMLATECARVLGYRDSYLLFSKNRSLYKIIITQAEKDDLIDQEILPFSYRSRQIALVTAKSMFRQFGSRIIVNGRRVRDDYWETKARKQGFTEDDAAGETRPGAGASNAAVAASASVSKSLMLESASSSTDHPSDVMFASRSWSTNHGSSDQDSIQPDHFSLVDGPEWPLPGISPPFLELLDTGVDSQQNERYHTGAAVSYSDLRPRVDLSEYLAALKREPFIRSALSDVKDDDQEDSRSTPKGIRPGKEGVSKSSSPRRATVDEKPTGLITSSESDDDTEYSIDDGSDGFCNLEQSLYKQSLLSGRYVRPVISLVRQRIIDRLMEAFWATFNDHEHTNTTNQDGSTSDPASGQDSLSTAETSSASIHCESYSEVRRGKQKRKIDHGDGEGDGGDDANRQPKKQRSFLTPPDDISARQKFACPYRKNQPRKYRSNNRQWRSCALTPLESVARVKGHLYRHHMIYPCQRCKEVFESQEAVAVHLSRIQSCELRNILIADGVTIEIAEQLKSKKKSHRGESEKDRWQKIYRLLFPRDGDPGPSPYFEPPDDKSEVEEYSEYCRRELPRVVRAAIEEVVRSETQPLEERLMSQLDEIIRIAQDRVFANYRSAAADIVECTRASGGHQEVDDTSLDAAVALQSEHSYTSRMTTSPAIEDITNRIQPDIFQASSGPLMIPAFSATMENLYHTSASQPPNEASFEDFVHVSRDLSIPQTARGETTQSELEWLAAEDPLFYSGDVELDTAYTGDFQECEFGTAELSGLQIPLSGSKRGA